jgi:diguanylate cyclase (GGDEF)-like protein
MRGATATPGTKLESALVCPLIANHQFIAHARALSRGLATDTPRIIAGCSNRSPNKRGAVIHNAIVFEQTQVDSLTDSLTGLPNRRSLFDHLSRELARADAGCRARVALIVLDLDDFKAINDTYGSSCRRSHAAGGGRGAARVLRPYDMVVRYAGDEFVAVIAGCSRESAESKKLELQQRVSELHIEVRPGEELLLVASAGLSVFPHDAATYEALLADADPADVPEQGRASTGRDERTFRRRSGARRTFHARGEISKIDERRHCHARHPGSRRAPNCATSGAKSTSIEAVNVAFHGLRPEGQRPVEPANGLCPGCRSGSTTSRAGRCSISACIPTCRSTRGGSR